MSTYVLVPSPKNVNFLCLIKEQARTCSLVLPRCSDCGPIKLPLSSAVASCQPTARHEEPLLPPAGSLAAAVPLLLPGPLPAGLAGQGDTARHPTGTTA